MKKILALFLLIFLSLMLATCGGQRTVRAKPAPPVASSKPVPSKVPSVSRPTAVPSVPTVQPSAPPATPPTASTTPTTTPAPTAEVDEPGGYYLDDGPDANPPQDIDKIPNATPIKEPLLTRANKPYKALGNTYTPISSAQNYKARGVASWYGKRFHGRKTSSGEVYDMYSMSAAHTTLPLPSYVKVTNPANGRWVIVRVNDRGPFKHSRIIDLSYAAAHKLRLIKQGSGMVEVEAINADTYVASATAASAPVASAANDNSSTPVSKGKIIPVSMGASNNANSAGYFVQAGAFKNEVNANSLLRRIKGLSIATTEKISRVYNNGIHRLKVGPYNSRQDAEQVAANINKQLNTPTLILNQ